MCADVCGGGPHKKGKERWLSYWIVRGGNVVIAGGLQVWVGNAVALSVRGFCALQESECGSVDAVSAEALGVVERGCQGKGQIPVHFLDKDLGVDSWEVHLIAVINHKCRIFFVGRNARELVRTEFHCSFAALVLILDGYVRDGCSVLILEGAD